MSPRNSLIDKASTGDDEKSEKGKVKSTKKNRPAKTKNEGNNYGTVLMAKWNNSEWVLCLYDLALIPVIYCCNDGSFSFMCFQSHQH